MLGAGTPSPVNAFTVDLEDWYQGLEISMDSWGGFEDRLAIGTQKLLDLLAAAKVKATFFVLGYAAEKAPDLVREIQLQGHEIATHGYSHQFVYTLGPQRFRDDLLRSLEVLERIVDGPFVGHRAPFFSITKDADWAFEILAECGILYDSSVFPVHNYRYGIADAPRHFYQVHPGLMECPMSVYSNPFVNVPVGGGAYFRLFPYTFTRYGLRKINEAGHPAIFYLHPWELDPEHPRINLPRRIALTHYYNLAGTNKRLKRLLAEFHFTTMQDILKNDRID